MTVPNSREVNTNFIKSATPKQYAMRSSIQHWQLRDLICFGEEDPSVVYSVFHSQVNAFSLTNRSSVAALRDLSYSPTCLTMGRGYLAVGGQRSQVTVRQLGNDWMAATTIGGAINNCVHIADTAGQVRLYVCNNDETIKIFNLPSMDLAATLRFEAAVNGVATSPDGQRLVASCDTNHVYTYAITSSGTYEQRSVLGTTKEAGFSCAWDQSSSKFAVGCQDGFVCVWDIRKTSKMLARIASSQPSGRGAVRAVKFSHSGSVDLLAFTEHTSFFNVIDARTFEERDAVRIGPVTSEVNLTGIAFSQDSRSLLVSTEHALLEYDVNTRKRRVFPTGDII